MKLAFLVTARMGSTRLPAKHFLELANRPAMSHLLERVELAADAGDLVAIATGRDAVNHAFDIFGKPPRRSVFFGDDLHIPRRHAQAAESLDAHAIVAVDGDDPLTSIAAMKDVAQALREGETLVKTIGLPIGMNAFGYSAELLYSVVRTSKDERLDTGWGRIFEDHEATVIDHSLPEAGQVRMTLDYPEDLDFFRRVFEGCPPLTRNDDAELLRWILHHGVHSINRHLDDDYWRHFNAAQ